MVSWRALRAMGGGTGGEWAHLDRKLVLHQVPGVEKEPQVVVCVPVAQESGEEIAGGVGGAVCVQRQEQVGRGLAREAVEPQAFAKAVEYHGGEASVCGGAARAWCLPGAECGAHLEPARRGRSVNAGARPAARMEACAHMELYDSSATASTHWVER